MPEVRPDHVPSPRTLLAWDGTAYRPIHIDALGNVQIDVVASALPAGAATAAAQALALAQLQLIEDIRNALQTVATDRLIVRGEDQLFSFAEPITRSRVAVISGAGGWVNSVPVPAGQIWCITNVATTNRTSPTTARFYNIFRAAAGYGLGESVAAFAAWDFSYWNGFMWLDEGAVVRATFAGALAGDSCQVDISGYAMTLEV